MKTCPKCGVLKDNTAFHRNKRNKSGLSDWCKLCNNTRYHKDSARFRTENRARYWKDPAKARQQRTATRNPVAHRENERERAERYVKRSFEEIAVKRHALRPSGLKTCRKCHKAKRFREFGTNRRLADGLHSECIRCREFSPGHLRRVARFQSRGIFLACAYCGGPYEHTDHVWPVYLGGLDVADNLLPACAPCNLKKGKMSAWLWIAIIKPYEDPRAWFEAHQVNWKQWQHDQITS